MLITEIKGNTHDSPLPAGIHVETVLLSGDQLVKRVQRLRTDHGRDIGIRLPSGAPDLRDGDILHIDTDNAIVVRAEPTDVIVIQPTSILEMGMVAHALGNRHLPAQFFGTDSEYEAEAMVVQYDHTVIQYLDSVGVAYKRQQRVMPIPFRHTEHTH